MSLLVRLEGKHTTQNAHCAMVLSADDKSNSKTIKPRCILIFFSKHFAFLKPSVIANAL